MVEQALHRTKDETRVARYRAAEDALWHHYGVEPRERFVTLRDGGTRLRLLETGDGPAILFVHGSGPPGAASVWAPLAAELPELRCVMVDLPGDGLSPPLDERPGDHAIRLADLLADLLGSIDVERVHVAAWSIGGIWALRLAQRHPERVGRLVQMGFSPIWAGLEPPASIRLQSTPLGAVMSRMPATPGVVRLLLRRVVGHGASLDAGRIRPELIDWIVALMRQTDTARNDRVWIGRLIGWRGAKPSVGFTEHELAAIGKEMLYVFGTSDWEGTRAVAERTTGLLPSSRIAVVPDGGHAPWLDDPPRVAGAIRHFLAASRS